jgi:alpha-L-arabinofuranosidase
LNKPHTVEINWQDRSPGKVLSSSVLTGGDLKAFNSFDAPQHVAPQSADKPLTSSGRTRLELPARSYTAIQWAP